MTAHRLAERDHGLEVMMQQSLCGIVQTRPDLLSAATVPACNLAAAMLHLLPAHRVSPTVQALPVCAAVTLVCSAAATEMGNPFVSESPLDPSFPTQGQQLTNAAHCRFVDGHQQPGSHDAAGAAGQAHDRTTAGGPHGQWGFQHPGLPGCQHLRWRPSECPLAGEQRQSRTQLAGITTAPAGAG